MKLLFEKIINEGKNKEITFNQYKSKLNNDFDLFTEIVSLDPTYVKNSENLGDYGIWLLNLYTKNREDFNSNETKLTDLLTKFKENRSKIENKDINSYKTVNSLENALNNLKMSDRQLQRFRRNNSEYEIVGENKNWTMYHPLTYAGSCTLGKGASWCTAYDKGDAQYIWHTQQGNLYIFINKNNPKDKFQWHPATAQCLKADNETRVDIVEFFSENEDLLNDLKDFDKDAYDIVNIDIEKVLKLNSNNGVFVYTGEDIDDAIREHIKEIIVDDSVTSIEEWAFAGCTSLQSIKIPNSVRSIEEWAFDNCENLKSIEIPTRVTSIGVRAFGYCENLTSIKIPNMVTSIGKFAFIGCANLTVHTKNKYVIYYCIKNNINYDTDINESLHESEQKNIGYPLMGKKKKYPKISKNTLIMPDYEKGIEFFNHAMGTDTAKSADGGSDISTGDSTGMSSDGGGMGEGLEERFANERTRYNHWRKHVLGLLSNQTILPVALSFLTEYEEYLDKNGKNTTDTTLYNDIIKYNSNKGRNVIALKFFRDYGESANRYKNAKEIEDIFDKNLRKVSSEFYYEKQADSLANTPVGNNVVGYVAKDFGGEETFFKYDKNTERLVMYVPEDGWNRIRTYFDRPLSKYERKKFDKLQGEFDRDLTPEEDIEMLIKAGIIRS